MRFILLLLSFVMVCTNVNALVIVTTFPGLANDVKLIAPNDTVYSIPAYSHDYQLTPKDVDMLKKADVIVSTAHTHFEKRIEEMKEKGELKGILIEIPKVNGIKLLNYPDGGINPHMPIYDPENYKVFIRYLSKVLKGLNPSENYVERAEDVCRMVDEIVDSKRLNGTALVDYPYCQYAVTWMGLKVVGIAFERPTTPETFKKVDYLVLTRNSTKSKSLLENVECKWVVYVDSPFVKKSIPEKLRDIEVEKVEKTPGFTLLTVIACLIGYFLSGLRRS